ncbi:hypothetical protein [Streptomyces sp. NBC_01314]|uniref:hypothetical protein n=1 Tax=Streptomyces sp. NBC_01314 TaxID=2903821 RepID=UPI00308E867E|nr:hypothetical protein OG622_24225 [Streptomyces sp. NBC_01314]
MGTVADGEYDTDTDTGRMLREAFADAAYDVTPPPVPLQAIERDGRGHRRRRRAAALSTGCGLLLLPLVAVLTLRPGGPPATVQPMAPTAPTASASPTPTRISGPLAGRMRVVEPGERVDVGKGTQIWLTKEGKHAYEPVMSDLTEFQNLLDKDIDTSRPGAAMQEAASGTDYALLSGLYFGTRTLAAGVRLELRDGRTLDGTILRLSGNNEWGAWYVLTSRKEGAPHDERLRSLTRKVTVYDKEGTVLVSREFAD